MSVLSWLGADTISPSVPTSVSAALFLAIVGLTAVVRTLYKDGKAKDEAIQALLSSSNVMQQEQLKQSLTVTLDAANRIKESDQVMERVLTMIHQIASRSPTGEQLVEINIRLKELKDMKAGG